MKLLQQHLWDPVIEPAHRAAMERGWQALSRRAYARAAAGFWEAYLVLFGAQPAGRRIHKGESLHNYGLALLWAGHDQPALAATFAAFVEDAASAAEEQPRAYPELLAPAAHNLLYVFGIGGPELIDAGRAIRALVHSGEVAADPHDWLQQPWAIAVLASARLGTKQLGRQRLPPERRIFVGGWYGRLTSELRPLAAHLDSKGWEAIVVADYAVPPGWGEDEVALAALGLCQYAIFDVTEPSGAIEEIAHVPETMRKPARLLAVFDAAHGPQAGTSRGMTLAKLQRWDVTPQPYSTLQELLDIAERWISR